MQFPQQIEINSKNGQSGDIEKKHCIPKDRFLLIRQHTLFEIDLLKKYDKRLDLYFV